MDMGWVLMMPFSTGTGLERMGSSGRTETADGLDWWMLDCLGWGRIAAMSTCGLRCGVPLQKEPEGKKGRRGLCPWPLRCLSQILSERIERMLRLLSIGVPFTDELSMYLSCISFLIWGR